MSQLGLMKYIPNYIRSRLREIKMPRGTYTINMLQIFETLRIENKRCNCV